LLYTDPSGYFSVKSVLKLAAVVVISYVTAGIAGGMAWAAAFGVQVGSATAYAVVAAGGALSGFIMTGSLEGALWGAFSAMTFYGIGQWMPGGANGNGVFNSNYTATELAGASLTHGAAGGVISHMQGGKFGHGFLSAGVTKVFSPAIHDDSGNRLAQTAIAAVVGGSVSQATGGKFANGAVTAAMAFALNQAQDRLAERSFLKGASISFEGDGAERLKSTFDSLWSRSRGFRAAVMDAHGKWGSLEFTGISGSGRDSQAYQNRIQIDLNSRNIFIETRVDGYHQSRRAELRAQYQPLSIDRVMLHEVLHSAHSSFRHALVHDDDDRSIIPMENRIASEDGLFGGRQRLGHNRWITAEHYRELRGN
jgi:hypothetical protein